MSIRAVSLQALGVGKSFGSFQALKGVTLDVGRGEFLTLLGPSGSGKTTFLMIVAGFEQPTVGRLMSEGEDITERSAETRSFGMVFQGYALFPHMTVAQNIAFPLQVRKIPRDVTQRRVGEIGAFERFVGGDGGDGQQQDERSCNGSANERAHGGTSIPVGVGKPDGGGKINAKTCRGRGRATPRVAAPARARKAQTTRLSI